MFAIEDCHEAERLVLKLMVETLPSTAGARAVFSFVSFDGTLAIGSFEGVLDPFFQPFHNSGSVVFQPLLV